MSKLMKLFNMNKLIAQRIRKKRKEKGLLQKQLAYILGWKESKMNRIENRTTVIIVVDLINIAKALQTDIMYFLNQENN